MKFRLFLIFILSYSASLFSQEVISSQGDSYTNSNGGLVFTIGEVVTSTCGNAGKTLTQGFHQTIWSFLNIEDNVPNFKVLIFPNPTENYLNIKSVIFKDVTYCLFDEMGKIILNGKLYSEKISLDVSRLYTGIYSLVLYSPKNKLKTFNFIKTR